jgi:hypothetical protein
MPPKSWIVYIDGDNETRACLDYGPYDKQSLEAEGNKVIGYVNSGCMADAIKYADEVLR